MFSEVKKTSGYEGTITTSFWIRQKQRVFLDVKKTSGYGPVITTSFLGRQIQPVKIAEAKLRVFS